MLCGKVSVPDTSSNMSVSALPLVVVGTGSGSIEVVNVGDGIVSGYCSLNTVGATIVWVLGSPSAVPTAQDVVDKGTPIVEGTPVSVQDPGGSPTLPDLTMYYAATISGTGDLRVIS